MEESVSRALDLLCQVIDVQKREKNVRERRNDAAMVLQRFWRSMTERLHAGSVHRAGSDAWDPFGSAALRILRMIKRSKKLRELVIRRRRAELLERVFVAWVEEAERHAAHRRRKKARLNAIKRRLEEFERGRRFRAWRRISRSRHARVRMVAAFRRRWDAAKSELERERDDAAAQLAVSEATASSVFDLARIRAKATLPRVIPERIWERYRLHAVRRVRDMRMVRLARGPFLHWKKLHQRKVQLHGEATLFREQAILRGSFRIWRNFSSKNSLDPPHLFNRHGREITQPQPTSKLQRFLQHSTTGKTVAITRRKAAQHRKKQRLQKIIQGM